LGLNYFAPVGIYLILRTGRKANEQKHGKGKNPDERFIFYHGWRVNVNNKYKSNKLPLNVI
jgi:hypothetical protein